MTAQRKDAVVLLMHCMDRRVLSPGSSGSYTISAGISWTRTIIRTKRPTIFSRGWSSPLGDCRFLLTRSRRRSLRTPRSSRCDMRFIHRTIAPASACWCRSGTIAWQTCCSASGETNCTLIISNHGDRASWAQLFNIPFSVFPVTKETKAEQEQEVLLALKEHHVE
jgi:hypothetical protein